MCALAEIAWSCSSGVEAVGSTGSGPAVAQLQEAGDPYFEELVEDIGDDPQKAHALQQGVAPVARFFEDTAVEIEPGELAVDVVFGASQVGSPRGSPVQGRRLRELNLR